MSAKLPAPVVLPDLPALPPEMAELTPERLNKQINDLRKTLPLERCFNKPNPYTGEIITSLFDYDEYLQMHAVRTYYAAESKKWIDAYKLNVEANIIPKNAALAAHSKLVSSLELEKSTQSKEISNLKNMLAFQKSSVQKQLRLTWLSAILAVIITCCIFLIGVIPSNKRAADSYALRQYDAGYSTGKSDGYTSGKSDGYDKGYSAGTDDGYKDGWQKGYESGTRRSNSVANMPKYTPPDTSTTTSDVVYVTHSGSKYHKAGCSYLKSSYEMSRSEAIAAGYEPCSRCKP